MKLFPSGRSLTPIEVGLIVAVVLILVACCCGFTLLGLLVPHSSIPAPVYTPIPTPSY